MQTSVSLDYWKSSTIHFAHRTAWTLTRPLKTHSRLRRWREPHSIETQSTYIHFLNAAFNETTTSALPTPVYAVFGMTWPLLTSNMNYEGGRRETGGGDKMCVAGSPPRIYPLGASGICTLIEQCPTGSAGHYRMEYRMRGRYGACR